MKAPPQGAKTEKVRLAADFFRFGDLAGIRTRDTLLKRQVLCLLSYQVIFLFIVSSGVPARLKIVWGEEERSPRVRREAAAFHSKRGPRAIGDCVGRGGAKSACEA